MEFIKAFGGSHGTSYTASCKAGEYYLIAANKAVGISGSISLLYSKTSDISGTVSSYQALFVTTGTSFSVTTSNTSAQLAKLTFWLVLYHAYPNNTTLPKTGAFVVNVALTTPVTLNIEASGGAVIIQPYVGDRAIGTANIKNFPCGNYHTATITATIPNSRSSVTFGTHTYTSSGTYTVDVSELEDVNIVARIDRYTNANESTKAIIVFQ